MGWLMPGRRSQGAATTKVIDLATGILEYTSFVYGADHDLDLTTGTLEYTSIVYGADYNLDLTTGTLETGS